MTSRELLKGLVVDLNRLIDAFADRVERGAPVAFGTFEEVWKSMQMSFLLVCAPSEAEVESHIQDVFMCALDRFDLPSPLKHGQSFGELHKPRLRRARLPERRRLFCNMEAEDTQNSPTLSQDEESDPEKSPFCDCFKEAPDFPRSKLRHLVSFEERVAVFYVLYCVYKEQCLEPRVCIHIPVDVLPSLVEFLPKLMERHALDAVYMFQELWQENAFVFDVLRRPPSFLCLSSETSESEAKALRDLSFHLKTSLKVKSFSLEPFKEPSSQDLSRLDDFEKACDEYGALQEQLVNSELGQKHNASHLITFNCDVGRWMRNVTDQELQQVHQGITGMTSREYNTKTTSQRARFPHPKAGTKMDETKKRKWMESLPKITISGDDSWGITVPGLPKMARVVMMRDRQRRKALENTSDKLTTEDGRPETSVLVRSLRSDDFREACPDLCTVRSDKNAAETSVIGEELLSEDFQGQCPEYNRPHHEVRTPAAGSPLSKEDVRHELAGESPDANGEKSQHEVEYDASDDDEEMRQWKEEIESLNAEIGDVVDTLPPKTP